MDSMLRFKPFLLSVLLCCVTLSVAAQEFPYSLDWRREATLLGIGGGLSIGSHLAERHLDGLTSQQMNAQRRSDVWVLDRGATRQLSEAHRNLSDDLLRGAMLVPATLFLHRPARSKVLVMGVLLAETMLLNDGLTKATKVLVRRNRPLTYNPAFGPESRTANDARQSFVSGHTSNTAALSFFTAKVFHDLHPGSPWRPVVWAGAAAIPLATGYARYRAGKHFPTDIAAGYALGAALGILIPQWHKNDRQPGWSLEMAGNGVGVALRW